jgi:lipoprotein-releasing system permease protein
VSYRLFVARKFISPKKESGFITFVTLISIIGVAIGVASLIIAVSVLTGFEKEITERAVSLSSHIQITSFKQEGIKDYRSILQLVADSLKSVQSATPYVQKEAVLKYKDKTEGIIVKGIRNQDDIFRNRRQIIAGSSELKEIDSSVQSIIIGNKLASKFGINLGDKVFILATNGIPSPLNTPNIKQFKVAGIYESGLREYDDVMLYIDFITAQKLFQMGNNITGIELIVKDISRIDEVNERVKKLLGYPYNPRTIFRIFKGLFTWVELQKKPIPIIIGLIIIVAAFNIIGTLLMIVLEKTKEIGILKTLGSTGRDIISIFSYQGMLIAVTGIILGNILGYGLCLFQLKYNIISLPDIYFMSKVPIIINWEIGLIITLITMAVCFLATFVPSYLASKLKPVTAIRFN